MSETKSLDLYEDLCTFKIDKTELNVKKNLGDLAYMISIKDLEDKFELKIQIESASSDDIIFLLNNSALQHSRIEEILTSVRSKMDNSSLHGLEKIMEIYQLIKTENANSDKSHSEAVKKNKKSTKMNQKQRKDSKRNSKSQTAPAERGVLPTEKLPPMKTATDVVNRIRWDTNIPVSDIIIGYHDRFLGILEKPFDVFSWEDLASLDYYTFAIPKHRIAYFKYRKAVIWHKENRLDRVFGSRGSEETVDQVIENYRDEDYDDVSKPEEPSGQDKHSSVLEFSEAEDLSDDDSDDGIQVIVNVKHQKKVEELSDEDLEDDNDASQNKPQREYWTDKLRPNFFICVRVTNPEIRKMVSHIQDIICQKEPHYASCCSHDEILHITLCTLRLQDAEQVTECLQVLNEAKQDLQRNLPKQPLRLSGIDRFFGRVLYAKVSADKEFYEFVAQLNMELRAAGMPIADSHAFIPHMSILKVNRPTSRALGSKYIPYFLEDESQIHFGEQIVDSIYLCSMEKTKGPDGFYLTPGSVTFMREVLTTPL